MSDKELNKLIDSRLSRIESDTSQRISSIEYELTQRISDIESDTSQRISSIESELSQRISSNYKALEQYLEMKNSEVHTLIMNELKNRLYILEHYLRTQINSIEKRIDDVEGTIGYNHIWNSVLGIFGFTAVEWFDSTEVTCEDWNDSGITCAEFYMNGKEILGFNIEKRKILSPITGEVKLPEEILMDLIMKLNVSAMTACDYDKLGITVGEYDKMKLKASQSDWRGEYVFRENK